MAGAFAVGAISGGAFNPAVGLGPIIANASYSQNGVGMLLYASGPLAGALLASFVYTYTTGKENK